MNRREFITGTAAAIAAVSICGPAIAERKSFLPASWLEPVAPAAEDYVCVMHPDALSGFMSIHRRGQWKDAHASWRRAGRPGSTDAQSIWDRYGAEFSAPTGEIGSFEGVRFIESRSVL